MAPWDAPRMGQGCCRINYIVVNSSLTTFHRIEEIWVMYTSWDQKQRNKNNKYPNQHIKISVKNAVSRPVVIATHTLWLRSFSGAQQSEKEWPSEREIQETLTHFSPQRSLTGPNLSPTTKITLNTIWLPDISYITLPRQMAAHHGVRLCSEGSAC